jgi:mono/diheme cytochrome c family protein
MLPRAAALSLLLLTVALGLAATARTAQSPSQKPSPDAAGFAKSVRPFLDSYCITCHSGASAQGGFRADTTISIDFADPVWRAKWAETLRVLNSHTMPPKGARQPPPSETAQVVDWITTQTVKAEQAMRSRAPVLRRLTRDEYHNAVLQLTGVDFDVTGFPADPSAGGFDNNARALSTSPLHIELYANAARQILDRALQEGPQPPRILWRFDPKAVPDDSRRVVLDKANSFVIVNGGNNREEGDWVITRTNGWDRSVNARNYRVPVEGTYIVRLRAACRIPTREEVVRTGEAFLANRRAQQLRENPQGARYHEEAYQNDLRHLRTDPMYNYGPPRVRLIQHLGAQPKTVAEFDVDNPVTSPKTYEFRVRHTTEMSGLNWWNEYSIPSVLENFWFQKHDNFARPELWIDWWEIEGPVYDAWPPGSTTRILFPSPLRQTNERAYARAVLARFMQRAYRRPVTDEEVNGRLALYDRARTEQSFLEAIKVPLTAVLLSPHFLYWVEETPGALKPHALANRLSAFLTAAPPDAELTASAEDGSILKPDVLLAQTRRLLASAGSFEFTRRFASQWLGLGQVGANPPAPDLYPEYDRHYETSMVQEGIAFFREVLRSDTDALALVRSDFVVINERLARAYGIPGVRGDHFRRVPVPAGVRRGGVPTMAAVHTITSNGTRTSPVKRGTWVMRTLLDMDPGLPVADAGEIAAKVPGIEKATLRRRLEIHRTRAQCARCHNHIDPWGFALENYNAAGIWRDHEGFGYKGRVERDDPLIDNSSVLADGTAVNGVEGLQRAVLARSDDFLRCLASKLMTYAFGREMGVADRPLISAAVAHMQRSGRTVRSLVEFIVLSQPFRSR